MHVNYAGSGLLPENKCQHMITLSLIFLHWIINEMFPLLNIDAVVNGYSKIFNILSSSWCNFIYWCIWNCSMIILGERAGVA